MVESGLHKEAVMRRRGSRNACAEISAVIDCLVPICGSSGAYCFGRLLGLCCARFSGWSCRGFSAVVLGALKSGRGGNELI